MASFSIGDILMLSQTAWKIGRAFTAGRKNAPAEFLNVEAEINALAKALKLLAEAMFDEEDALLDQADQDTKDGFTTILRSCQRTIQDLDSLIDQYQAIKKTKTAGGFTVERSWSELVVGQYQTMMWTADGGDIKHLRELLKTHTNSTSLIKQALGSHELSRLESVVSPMADKVDSISRKSGTLGQQLDQATRIVQEIANQPSQPSSPSEHESPHSDTVQQSPTSHESFSARDYFPQRQNHGFSRYPPPSMPGSPNGRLSPVLSSNTASSLRSSIPPPSPTSSSQKRQSNHTVASSTRPLSSVPSRGEESYRSLRSIKSVASPVPSHHESLGSSSGSKIPEWEELQSQPDLGPVILAPKVSPAIMDYPIHRELENCMSDLSIQSVNFEDISKLHRSSITESQSQRFWKQTVRNAAILCDIRGTAVEYARKVSPDPEDHEVIMITACNSCRVAVVRKREASAEAKEDVQIMTSIWVFSDDNTLRMELKLADGGWYVPYSSYFNLEKVSVTVPCELKFHDIHYGQRALKTEKTNWINYIFDSPEEAALFQNELMGRTLLRTFRTSQTMRVHEGLLAGTFTYAEQICGMENLRIWEDNETLAVIALIHFSPQFKNGYLAFYLNSASEPIKVKDEGGKVIKLKGLRVPIEKGVARKDSMVGSSKVADSGGGGGSKGKGGKGKGDGGVDKKKVITGARVEFATELEKRDFLALIWQVQGTMRNLPPLSGVN